MKKTLLLTLVITLAIGVAFAQSRGNGPGNGGNGNQTGTQTPPFDLSQLTTFDGSVVSFLAGAGLGNPQLTIQRGADNLSFVLGPYRYLTSQNFVARAGDAVHVSAWPCATCPAGYAVKDVQNLTTGVTLNLRDANGLPLFTSGGQGGPRGSGNGQGMGPGTNCGNGPRGGGNGVHQGQRCNGEGPDMTAVRTVSGSVKSFTGGYRAGIPTLVLTTADGDLAIVVSPFRAVAASGFEFKEGMLLNVTTAPVKLEAGDEWIAVQIVDPATGVSLQLRDATTGLPLFGRR
jgi:hypothetical protein